MSSFTSFKDCIVELGSHQIFATSADLSLNTSLERDVRFESFSRETAGSVINSPRLVPTAGVKGTFSFNFVICQEHFDADANKIISIFQLNKGMSPELTKIGRIGNYRFFNAGIKSLRFTMRPFSLIEASAEYEIFGSVVEVPLRQLSRTSERINPAEGLKSFGTVTANGINVATQESYDINLISATYSITARRKFNYTIRANEHPTVRFIPGAMMPYRVSLTDLTINCEIESNKIIPNMNEYGNIQNTFNDFNSQEIEVSLNLFQARNKTGNSTSKNIANFDCIGNVTDQSLSVSDGSYLTGNFSLMQVLK